MSEAGVRLFDELMRFKPAELTANGWAVKAGVSRTIWSDLRRHGNPSRRTLEKLLLAAGSTLAEFEALRVGSASLPDAPAVAAVTDAGSPLWRAAPLPPVPLLDTTLAGEWGEPGSRIELTALHRDRVVGQVTRPASMAGDREAYAVTIVGDSMWPRFRPGRRLLVSPAAPVAIGDDVLVLLAREGLVLIKELTIRSASRIGLRQFNPDISFEVDAVEIRAVHKVVGEAI